MATIFVTFTNAITSVRGNRPVSAAAPRPFTAAAQTLQDVQVALFEVIDALAANSIDHKRASALLFALQQASLHHRMPRAA